MKKILVVDDRKVDLDLYKEYLEEENFGEIYTENIGKEAIERNKKERFDLILLDIRLQQEIDGIDVLKAILKDNPECCVITITAYAEIDTAVESMKLGAYDYLKKPISNDDLIKAVKKGIEYLDQKERIKRLEEEKRQAEIEVAKREAICEVTRGFAHGIKKVLWSITGNVKSLKSDENKEIIDDILEDVNAIERGIDGLLDYSKKPVLEDDVNLHEIIENIERIMCLKGKFNGIEISRNYDTNLPNIKGDRLQLSQIFQIILENAVEAIQEKAIKKGLIEISTYQDDKFVKVSIKDDGIGIPNEYKKHIFTPFFTTKDLKQGIGIGLSIAMAHIRYHKGDIKVDSKLNKGTTFTISLPKVSKEE